jgi:hypothetical protein
MRPITAGEFRADAFVMFGYASLSVYRGNLFNASVIAEGREHRPLDARGVHLLAGGIDQLFEVGVHPADHIVLERQAHPRRGRDIFPGEIADASCFSGSDLAGATFVTLLAATATQFARAGRLWWPGTLEDAADINAGLAICGGKALPSS